MPMTRPWREIVAGYATYPGAWRSIHALETLTRQISESPLSTGLFAWTSMFDLCIAQNEVSYPYDGPRLRISPLSPDQLEFRYEDTLDKAKQWHRTVDSEEAAARLLKFLDQLRWLPPESLKLPSRTID